MTIPTTSLQRAEHALRARAEKATIDADYLAQVERPNASGSGTIRTPDRIMQMRAPRIEALRAEARRDLAAADDLSMFLSAHRY